MEKSETFVGPVSQSVASEAGIVGQDKDRGSSGPLVASFPGL